MKRPVLRSICSANRPGRPLCSPDGLLEYSLTPVPAGLFVERVLFRGSGTRAILAAVFADRRSFNRWCDADAARFDYPTLHMSLKRDGNALLAA